MEICVVGGGAAGLMVAVLAAGSGAGVTVLEGSGTVGGRARSTRLDSGHVLNLGPHAVYVDGPADRALSGLGLGLRGRPPVLDGGRAVIDGRLEAMPDNLGRIATTGALSLRGRAQAVAAFARVTGGLVPDPGDPISWGRWLDVHASDPTARDVMAMFGRVSAYLDDPDAAAGTVLGQLRRAASSGVRYLHGGWQTIVDDLAALAADRGVTVRTGTPARSLRRRTPGIEVGTPEDVLLADRVVLAGLSPRQASALLAELAPDGAHERMAAAVPVRAAVLDLALSALPVPERTYALGADSPTYLSVHSAASDLAPGDGAVVHVMRYLRPGEEDPTGHRAQLEAFTDLVQPGWRRHVVSQRFLPHMTVAHDVAPASLGGLPGRVPVAVADDIALAGDWVGPEGWLLDAVAASATAAAAHVTDRLPAAVAEV